MVVLLLPCLSSVLLLINILDWHSQHQSPQLMITTSHGNQSHNNPTMSISIGTKEELTMGSGDESRGGSPAGSLPSKKNPLNPISSPTQLEVKDKNPPLRISSSRSKSVIDRYVPEKGHSSIYDVIASGTRIGFSAVVLPVSLSWEGEWTGRIEKHVAGDYWLCPTWGGAIASRGPEPTCSYPYPRTADRQQPQLLLLIDLLFPILH